MNSWAAMGAQSSNYAVWTAGWARRENWRVGGAPARLTKWQLQTQHIALASRLLCRIIAPAGFAKR